MTLVETVGTSLLCAVAALVLRECKSPLSPLLTLLCGILLFGVILSRVSPLVAFGERLAALLPPVLGETVGKVLAAGLLCGVGADVCTELGASALGERLALFGKVEILLLSLPLFSELFARAEALLS